MPHSCDHGWFWRDDQKRARCGQHAVVISPELAAGRQETLPRAVCTARGLPYPSAPDGVPAPARPAPPPSAPPPGFEPPPEPSRGFQAPPGPAPAAAEPDVEVFDGPAPAGAIPGQDGASSSGSSGPSSAPPHPGLDPETAEFLAELYLDGIVFAVKAKSGWNGVTSPTPVELARAAKAIKMVIDRRLPPELTAFDDILLFAFVTGSVVKSRVDECKKEVERRQAHAQRGPAAATTVAA
jgi:hypothetical protein